MGMTPNQSYESAGSSTLVMGLKIFGYAVLAGIMGLFLSFSIRMLSSAALTETIGYYEYEVIDGETVLIDTVYYDEDSGYEAVTSEDDRLISREMITQPKNVICAVLITVVAVLEQALMIVILVLLTGYYVWREGDRDRNLVKHHERTPTPLRGLWIGLIAAIPSLALYALLVAGKLGVMSDSVQGVYRFLNASFTPLINLIMPTQVYPATNVAVWQLFALLALQAVLPLSCAAAYTIGYKRLWKHKKKTS